MYKVWVFQIFMSVNTYVRVRTMTKNGIFQNNYVLSFNNINFGNADNLTIVTDFIECLDVKNLYAIVSNFMVCT